MISKVLRSRVLLGIGLIVGAESAAVSSGLASAQAHPAPASGAQPSAAKPSSATPTAPAAAKNSPAASTDDAARVTLAAVQTFYEQTRDVSADFHQTYVNKLYDRTDKSRGRVVFKKPGKMRWDYTNPEKKLFISDGRTIYFHLPADRQVIKNDVPEGDQATSAVLFLMGKGDIVRDFTIRWAEGGDGTQYRLRLDPKARQAEYDWLEVAADRETLRIVGLTAGDGQGGRSSFTFSNYKENVGLADKMFQFSIPRGTEVISGKTP